MAALDFPSSPSVNQVYTANGYSWYWNGTAWVSYAYINGGTINNTSIGATTPSTGAFTTLSSSSTTTLNGTTIPASKTLVVTTDKLSALAATTSSELAGVISDETGSGSLVFATSPTLVTPNLGTPSAIVLTNASGTASININGTVGATTANVGYFTTISATNNITTSGGYVGYAVTGTIHAISSTGYNGPVGATTANTGAFTTLSATGTISTTAASSYGTVIANGPSGGQYIIRKSGISYGSLYGDDASTTLDSGGGSSLVLATGGSARGTFSSTGLAVTGALSATGQLTVTGAAQNAFGSTFTPTAWGVSSVDINHASGGLLALYYGGSAKGYLIALSGGGIGVNTQGTGTHDFNINGTQRGQFSTTGLAVTGDLSTTGKLNAGAVSGGSNTAGDIQARRSATQGVYYFGDGNDKYLYFDGSKFNLTHAIEILGSLNSSGSLTASGTLTISGISSLAAARFNGSPGSLGNGVGVEVGYTSSNGYVQSYDRTNNIYYQLNLGGSEVHLNIGGSDKAVVTSTGLAVTGTTASTSSASGTTTFNSNNTGGSGDRYHLVCRESGTERGSITSNGSATSFNTSSDARLKTNIRDYSAGDLIDLLKPRLFDWKSGEKDSIGFVAQELAEVYPHAVTAGDDGEEITQQWGVDFSKLVPVLVAELKSVRARLAALEAQ